MDANEGDTDDVDDTPAIATVNGVCACNCDWNDIEKSERPANASRGYASTSSAPADRHLAVVVYAMAISCGVVARPSLRP